MPNPSGSPLGPLPPDFATTVASLHRVAEQLVAPARKPDNEISLRATPGGFGTPEFEYGGTRRQVRVEGVELVHFAGDAEHRAPLSALRDAAIAVADLLPAGTELDDAALAVDADAARALAEWFAFGAARLGELSGAAGPADAATGARLWPEHFDIAIEMGEEARGLRCNYGFSPGDEGHAEPYLYVGPWSAPVAGELWNAEGFSGAELGYAELLAAPDQAAMAKDFLETRRDALLGYADHDQNGENQ
jgi:hypothetical protein